MDRILTFEQISDSRFGGTKNKLFAINKSLMKELNKLDGLSVEFGEVRELGDGKEQSFRQRYFIKKTGKKTTWRNVYSAVNKVQAVPYNFLPTVKLN